MNCPTCGRLMHRGPVEMKDYASDIGQLRTWDWWCLHCMDGIEHSTFRADLGNGWAWLIAGFAVLILGLVGGFLS